MAGIASDRAWLDSLFMSRRAARLTVIAASALDLFAIDLDMVGGLAAMVHGFTVLASPTAAIIVSATLPGRDARLEQGA
jgi:ABC-type spermidine/putrescine transport system permease subunit II